MTLLLSLLLWCGPLVAASRIIQPRRLADEQRGTAFDRLVFPNPLAPADLWLSLDPPANDSRPISAICLAEMASGSTNSDRLVTVAPFDQILLSASPRMLVPATKAPHPLFVDAMPLFPGFSFLAPNRTLVSNATASSHPTVAEQPYVTTDVKHTRDTAGQTYVTSYTIDGVVIEGTFARQASPLLPQTPSVPLPPSVNKSYSQLLSESFWFFEQQRSGLLYHPNRVPWRNNSGLHDGLDQRLDLTGGYYDAGDYIKCTFPLSATLSYLAFGGLHQASSITKAHQLGYYDQMLRWGYDWLIKAHPSPDTLYVHIGDTERDNDYWGGDQHIIEPRPAFQVNESAPGTDVAAGTAAAFAAGSVIYATVFHDTAYASVLLEHAHALFSFAENTTRRLYQTSVPQVASAYSSSDYGDELVWAALQLFRATSDPYFLSRADSYASHYALADYAIGAPVDWDSKHGIALLLGAQLESQGAGVSYAYGKALDRYIDNLLGAHTTPAGLLWFDGSSADASLVVAVNSAFMLFSYAALPHVESERRLKALALADHQLDYVLGNNPARRVYITGATPSSPQNPQSAMASGGASDADMDTVPEHEIHQLYGALVGGPNEHDDYDDVRSNYRQSEIALDYNALLTPLLAMKAGQDEVPFYARP